MHPLHHLSLRDFDYGANSAVLALPAFAEAVATYAPSLALQY